MDKNQQELMFKLSMFEQQIQSINQQLQAVENSILDMNSLIHGLEGLKGKKDSEILSSIGRGIFVKSQLLSEELIVDVGGKNLVKKSIPDTQELIKEQLTKLEEIQGELQRALESINGQLTETIMAHQKQEESK